jgi:WD40 repeat protein
MLVIASHSLSSIFFHRFQVRGLEFNAIAPNLLASGADDGEICIWDLANPAEPSHFPPLRVGCHYVSLLYLKPWASLIDAITPFWRATYIHPYNLSLKH